MKHPFSKSIEFKAYLFDQVCAEDWISSFHHHIHSDVPHRSYILLHVRERLLIDRHLIRQTWTQQLVSFALFSLFHVLDFSSFNKSHRISCGNISKTCLSFSCFKVYLISVFIFLLYLNKILYFFYVSQAPIYRINKK